MRMKKFLGKIYAFLLMTIISLGVIGASTAYASDLYKLVDSAGLLSDDEATKLVNKLDQVSKSSGIDVVVVTLADKNLVNAESAADDIYDYSGYGQAEDRSGVLLYINMETRDWHISTRGYGITAFTDAGIDYIGKAIKEDLSNGNYYQAFDKYADLCDDFVAQAKAGKPYDVGHMPKEPYPILKNILISLLVGAVVALIYVLILRGELKSVAPKDSAADYVKNGSMNVRDAGSIYLYSRVTRTEKQSSSGGGSSTHTSSSGATHGGGGGKF